MLSKNISPTKLGLCFPLAVFLCFSSLIAQTPLEEHQWATQNEIRIIYPKANQAIGAVDSTFILGHLPPTDDDHRYLLFINKQLVPVHPEGGFIGWLPINPGAFEFNFQAYLVPADKYSNGVSTLLRHQIDSSDVSEFLEKVLVVQVPQPLTPFPLDSLAIDSEYQPPLGDLYIPAGGRLIVSFKGTPGCHAWFGIPGVVDSLPMAEISPRPQPYWGEAVFGAGNIPESLLVEGIYTGFYEIPASTRADSVRIKYYLSRPTPAEILWRYWQPPYSKTDLTLLQYLNEKKEAKVEKESAYRISLNSPDFPVTLKFTDSVLIVRHAPRRGYQSIFQPKGVEALAVGAEGDWYQIELSKYQTGWVSKASVSTLPKGILRPQSYLSVVRLRNYGDKLTIEFPLSGMHPFKVIEDDKRTIRLQLFGVTTDTDWIRYDFSDPLVHIATWSQPEAGVYELKLQLTQDIWGYDTYYEGNRFYWQLNRAPENVKSLKGKTIVVDPGHSADAGSIGPTGLTEKEANLAIALELKEQLEREGAKIVMTRADTSHVALYDRPAIAKIADADLFVSIHNNALPDGVNPLVNHGSATFYYHPHSLELARSIHKVLVEKLELGDYGLYYGNLAVNRPTQYPAVLVECAFMILPEHEVLLKTKEFQQKTAKAIVEGIEGFLESYHDGNRKR